MTIDVSFPHHTSALHASLVLPYGPIRGYALLCHCFSCGVDNHAASHISQALIATGIGVLRFDLTGRGNQDGDPANPDFAANTDALLSAVAFLRREYQAPFLLIGHSLGGAAVLAMAGRVSEATAVVTIGAPHSTAHVARHFVDSLLQVHQCEQAQVHLHNQKFSIKKQFLDDINSYQGAYLSELNKALLIMHSPLDNTVEISEADKIFADARHPKNFVCLHEADHLLSQTEDARYTAEIIASWALRYLPSLAPSHSAPTGKVRVAEQDGKFTLSINTDNHSWLADEPLSFGGANQGPAPYEHLLAALGACTLMTLRMYATHKAWPLDDVKVELYRIDEKSSTSVVDIFHRTLYLQGKLDTTQQQRLLEIANRCPVYKP